MKVTRRTLRAAYRLLAEIPPFANRELPPAVAVRMTPARMHPWGEYVYDERSRPRHTMRVNSALRSFNAILRTVAHEMCHLALNQTGARGAFSHGPQFRRLASRVCREMRWKHGGF